MEKQNNEITGYISIAEAARRLNVSDTRVYTLIEQERLEVVKIATVTYVSEESVKNFKPKSAVGRPRVHSPQWRYSPAGATLHKMLIRVRMYDEDKLDALVEQLKAIGEHKQHIFDGTVTRFISEDDAFPGTIEIELIWKENELPTEEAYQAMLQSFKEAFAHVLNWDTAQYGSRTVLLHT
jgi:excisionase family DNA binding protein